jgi:hypothetical protein
VNDATHNPAGHRAIPACRGATCGLPIAGQSIISCAKSNTGASTVCYGEPASIFHCVSSFLVRSVPGPTRSTSVRHDGHGIRELRGSPRVAPLRVSVRGAIAAGLFGDARAPTGGSHTDKFGVSNIRISPTGKRARYPFCRVNRQSRLADPARSGQSHQSCLGGEEHCRDFFDLALTANEGRGQCRQPGRPLPGWRWSDRRWRGRNAGFVNCGHRFARIQFVI